MPVLMPVLMPGRRLAAALAVLAAVLLAAAAPREHLELETGTGRLERLRSQAASVFVADPKVAEVHAANAGTLYLFGVGSGRTDVVAVDAHGDTLLDAEIVVRPSSFAALQAQSELARELPGRAIRVRPKVKGLIVTGQVDTPEDAARALAIARSFVAAGESVEDQLAVQSSVQVLLRVRLAEMSRSVVRALGVNWQALGSIGRFSISLATRNALPSTLTGAMPSRLQLGTSDVNAIVDALAQNNQVSIEFKQYGVQLAFVPTVLASGRISLHVRPEVSSLTAQGAVQLTAGNSSLQIPALTVRRAETTVELGSGQSFAIAGLLQDVVTHGASGLPGLGEIPVLGALFRSDSFQRQESELVVIVTPYVVRPVDDPVALHAAGEHYRPASDFERILQLRQTGLAVQPVRVPGEAGFIVQ